MRKYIKGIGHFGLSVADLEESVAFYGELLGLALSEKREKDAFFSVGEAHVLAIIQYPGGRQRFDEEMRPKHRGKAFTHFGFFADSQEAVFTMEALLRNAGVEIVQPAYNRRDGASLYFLDPNGYTLEFLYYSAP